MLPLRQEAPRLRPWRRPSSLASSGFRLLEVEPVADMPRVDRPRCGAVVTMVPWAEPGQPVHARLRVGVHMADERREPEDVSGFLHVAWRTAGRHRPPGSRTASGPRCPRRSTAWRRSAWIPQGPHVSDRGPTHGPQGPALPFMAARGTAAPARAPPSTGPGES